MNEKKNLFVFISAEKKFAKIPFSGKFLIFQAKLTDQHIIYM